jgi:hypothetical protein
METARFAVTDNIAANHRTGTAFFVQSSAAHSVATLTLTRITAVGNSVGVEANGTNSTLRLAQSTVTGNSTGYSAIASGAVLSYGDNYIDANGSNSGSLGSATNSRRPD